MKLTEKQLRNVIRDVIAEHVAGAHKEEPYNDYVKDFADGYHQEYEFEDYLKFGMEYGYQEDQLAEWWDAAGLASYQRFRDQELEDDLRTGRIDLKRNPYALD